MVKLIPSIVQFVGLTEGMKKNRLLYKEVRNVERVDAPICIKRAKEFLDLLDDAEFIGKNGIFEISKKP